MIVRASTAFDLGVVSSLGCQSCAGSGKQVVMFVDERSPMPSWVTHEERPCQPCGGTGIWAWEKEVTYHAGQTIGGLKRLPKRRLRGLR